MPAAKDTARLDQTRQQVPAPQPEDALAYFTPEQPGKTGAQDLTGLDQHYGYYTKAA